MQCVWCAALDAEEAGEGAFEDDAAVSERTDSQSVALETISIEEEHRSAPAAGGSAGADAGGFMRPDFDPFDPKAWEEQDPMLFAGVSAEPDPTPAAEEALEEIAISTALSGPSIDVPGPSGGTPAAAAARVPQSPLATAAAPIAQVGTDDPDADSDDDVVDARPALQSLNTTRTPQGSTQTTPGGITGSTAQLPLPPGADTAGGTFADMMPDPTGPALGCVVYGFEGEEDGELTVHEGEEVYIVELIDGGWAQVQLISTGEIGNIPEWAVQEMDQQLAIAIPPPGASSAILAQSSMISRQHSGRSASMDSGALNRTTSTPRPAPAPGQAMTPSAASASGHRRRGSVLSVVSSTGLADTPGRRAPEVATEDNPFAGGQVQPVDDNPFGLFDMGGGTEGDNTASPGGPGDAFGGGGDPFGLESLMGTSSMAPPSSLAQTGSAAAATSAAATAAVAAADGEEGAEQAEEADVPSTPAIDPALVLDTSVSAVPANTFASPPQQADDNPFGAAASTGMASNADNPFGQVATVPVAAPAIPSASSTASQNPFGTNKVEE